MPYTDQYERGPARAGVGTTGQTQKTGDLTYQISVVVGRYVLQHEPKYQTFAEVTGALVDCLTEFKRQISDHYEDAKQRQNGDVAEWAMIKERMRQLGVYG